VKIGGITLATLVGLGISGAEAVMPPWVYQGAREQATYHVQVKVTRVESPAQTPGECETTGEVIRIFRDRSGELRLGTTLGFSVSCTRPGDRMVVGGTLWTDHDRLKQAKYLEAFLNRVDQHYQVALWQSRIIEAPTDNPVIAITPPS
jgi:hypothetical protein